MAETIQIQSNAIGSFSILSAEVDLNCYLHCMPLL